MIYVAGHTGMVGRAVLRALHSADRAWAVAEPRVDLTDPTATLNFIERTTPDVIIMCAAKVGGIVANRARPAEFLYDNLTMQVNIIAAAAKVGVRKVVMLGSSCIYPRDAPQPLRPEYLGTGPLEPTNQAYAMAKLAGVAMAQAYRKQYGMDIITLMPCNLYGPNDNFDFNTSHVIPAMIAKFHAAKSSASREVVLWGDGSPLREFLHVDDLAAAVVLSTDQYSSEVPLNVGSTIEVSVSQLADVIAEIVGYTGIIRWNTDQPNGTPRKKLDITTITSMGWWPEISLRRGLTSTYEWYKENIA